MTESQFLKGVAWKERVTVFQGVQFPHDLKSEIWGKGRGHKKNIYIKGLPKKEGLVSIEIFRENIV